jgi:hypothetical protein
MTTMQRKMLWCAFALAMCACATPSLAQALRIEPRVQMSEQQRVRLQAVANEGADALRRYLWRTRMIHGWTWRDLVAAD